MRRRESYDAPPTLPEPVIGSTLPKPVDRRFDTLCRNFERSTGLPLYNKDACAEYQARNGFAKPCPFVHPDNPRWLELGGRIFKPLPSSSSTTVRPLPARTLSSSSGGPPPQHERPQPPPPLVTQASVVAQSPPIISPITRAPATVDPRRRPSTLTTPVDLAQLEASINDPAFIATIQSVIGASNSGAQSPSSVNSAPLASSMSNMAPQPQPQTASAPPPAVQPQWGAGASSSGGWGHQDPSRRDSTNSTGNQWGASSSTSNAGGWGRPPSPPREPRSWASSSKNPEVSSDPWAKPTVLGNNNDPSWGALPASGWGTVSADDDWGATSANWGAHNTGWGATGSTWPSESATAASTASSAPAVSPLEKAVPEVKPPLPQASTSTSATSKPPPAPVAQPVSSDVAMAVEPQTPLPPVGTDSKAEKLVIKASIISQPNRGVPQQHTDVLPRLESPDLLPASPDKAKADEDPEEAAWRNIIKELGNVYRDHARREDLEQEQHLLEALVERSKARAGTTPADVEVYTTKIAQKKKEIDALALRQEAKAAEWASASTSGLPPHVNEPSEAGVLRERRSKSRWPFEPPEGKYLDDERANDRLGTDVGSVKKRIQSVADTLEGVRSDLNRIQTDLAKELESLGLEDAAPISDAQPIEGQDAEEGARQRTRRQKRKRPTGRSARAEVDGLTREVERIALKIQYIATEPDTMWDETQDVVGIQRPPPDDDQADDKDVDEMDRPVDELGSDIDGMHIDDSGDDMVPNTPLHDAPDEAQPEAHSQPQDTVQLPRTREEIDAKLANIDQLQGIVDGHTSQVVDTLTTLKVDEMCAVDIAVLRASNADLKAKMDALDEQGKVEDVLLQQLFNTLTALEATERPDIDQLINGIVNPVVTRVQEFAERQFAARAVDREAAWQNLRDELTQLTQPTVIVLRAILQQTNALPPNMKNGRPNGVTRH